MSEKKPPIYAHCPAECKWETVHKSDFLAAATFIKEYPDADGNYILPPVKLYKIKTGTTSGAYNCTLNLKYEANSVDIEKSITYTEFDALRDYIYFEILSMTVNAEATELTVVFEVNGNRYSEVISGTSIDISAAVLKIGNAIEVYLHNSDAEIIATGADGQSAYDAAQAGGYTDTQTNFYADLAAMQGLASELEALL